MSMPQPQPLFTVDEYLAFERAAEDRHEYIDGHIYAMAGESPEHGDISANLIIALGTQLKGKPCRLRTKDTKVRGGPMPLSGRGRRGTFSYPDLVVICGEPEYHDAHGDIVSNPTAIVEVLSPSTENHDRGVKFARYQMWNPSLTDYLLVSQIEPHVEHFRRHPDGVWTFQRHLGLASRVEIPSIGCVLNLTDVYDRIAFRPSDDAVGQP